MTVYSAVSWSKALWHVHCTQGSRTNQGQLYTPPHSLPGHLVALYWSSIFRCGATPSLHFTLFSCLMPVGVVRLSGKSILWKIRRQSSLSIYGTLRTEQHRWKCEALLVLLTVRSTYNCLEMGRFLWSSGCCILQTPSVDQRDADARCKFARMKLLLQNESWFNPAILWSTAAKVYVVDSGSFYLSNKNVLVFNITHRERTWAVLFSKFNAPRRLLKTKTRTITPHYSSSS